MVLRSEQKKNILIMRIKGRYKQIKKLSIKINIILQKKFSLKDT